MWVFHLTLEQQMQGAVLREYALYAMCLRAHVLGIDQRIVLTAIGFL
jgi:hypothetical protein